jgi:hypothetical protein
MDVLNRRFPSLIESNELLQEWANTPLRLEDSTSSVIVLPLSNLTSIHDKGLDHGGKDE